jgi:hypothetical protein
MARELGDCNVLPSLPVATTENVGDAPCVNPVMLQVNCAVVQVAPVLATTSYDHVVATEPTGAVHDAVTVLAPGT